MQPAQSVEDKPPAQTVQPVVKEYSIRIAKKSKRRFNIMRFNVNQKVDFKKWKKARLRRENNKLNSSREDDEMPKFGAGSAFGRAAKEEARRRRFGIRSTQYNESNQPWVLKAHTDENPDGKMFKGTKEGGVGANSSYYIFVHKSDGCIEAYPLHEWYNFLPIQRYRMLNAEEAEEAFEQRDKVLNYFSVMVKKRIQNDDSERDDEELAEAKKALKKKTLKISEIDEWMSSGEDSDSEQENVGSGDEDDKKKKKKKANLKKKKKKKKASDDEAVEESDDGDEEGRECEYISDSSASDSELEQMKEVKSVAEEKGLKRLLASDDENSDSDSDSKSDEKDDKKDKSSSSDSEEEKKEKSKEKTTDKPKSNTKKPVSNKANNSSDSNSSDMNSDSNKAKSTREAGPSSADSKKRTLSTPDSTQAKKPKIDTGIGQLSINTHIPRSSETGITIEAVTRYLLRKPMTTIDLLKKFKAKCSKSEITKEEIGHVLMLVLAKINPSQQKVNGVTYYFMKK